MKHQDYTEQDIESELKKMWLKNGAFPTVEVVRDHSWSLCDAIYKHGRSINAYRLRLGIKISKRGNGYWSLSHLVDAIKPLIKDDVFPTSQTIRCNISSGAVAAINRLGGMRKLANLMGYNLGTFYVASDGHYLKSSLEYILDEYLTASGIAHEVDGTIVPHSKFRYDFKIDDLFIEIWGLSKHQKLGKRYLSKKMMKVKLYEDNNLKLLSIEDDVFNQSLKEVKTSLDVMFNRQGIKATKGRSVILHKAHRDNGWTETRIIREITNLLKATGRFPGQKEMRNGLADAVQRHGGINHFRKMMGYPLIKHNYWNDLTIMNELRQIYNKNHKIPTIHDIEKLGRKELVSAIGKRRGIVRYQKALNDDILCVA